MESYILMAICVVAWGATVALFKLFIMPDSDHAFVIGSIVGLLVAAAAGGGYYAHLASSSFA